MAEDLPILCDCKHMAPHGVDKSSANVSHLFNRKGAEIKAETFQELSKVAAVYIHEACKHAHLSPWLKYGTPIMIMIFFIEDEHFSCLSISLKTA